MLNCFLAIINYINKRKYIIHEVISKNTHSEVLLVKKKNNFYCLKIVKNRKRAAREIKLLKMFSKKKYFLDYYKSFIYDGKINIIVNYLPEGDLFTYINSFDKISLFNIKYIIYKMLIPLYFLNKFKYVHLDIKFENYMYKTDENGDISLILIDYESCHKLRYFVNKLDYGVGTKDYVAPEIQKNGIYTSTSDIWSLGVCLLKLLIGNKIIFKNYKNYKILDIKKNLAIVQENYSNFYVRLLKDMLNSNIYKRIKILDLILFLELDLKENKSFTPIQLN